MIAMTPMQIQSLLKDVQARLDSKRAATGVSLQVSDDAYRQDDDWLVVVVAPAQAGIRAYDYVQILNEVEKDLRDDGIKNVLLVPALAD
jgi:hypothetical protein